MQFTHQSPDMVIQIAERGINQGEVIVAFSLRIDWDKYLQGVALIDCIKPTYTIEPAP
jgi:hypothetical protein